MDKPLPIPEEAMLVCETCLKEIPQSEAHSEEAADYVANFCGLECYQQWKSQQQDKRKP